MLNDIIKYNTLLYIIIIERIFFNALDLITLQNSYFLAVN